MRRHQNSLSFKKLREANVSRCEAAFHKLADWSLTDWACAMAGESGEACNVVKKYRRLDGADRVLNNPQERTRLVVELGKELADVVIYADLLAARAGLSLDEEVRKKFNEVSQRRNVPHRL